MTCHACRTRRHGLACEGCACRCRAVLGLAGPFERDSTAPSSIFDPIDKTDLLEVAG